MTPSIMQLWRPAMRAPFAPAAHPVRFAALFTGSLIASLFFNGTIIEYFAVSLALLCLLTLAVLWRSYGDAMHLSRGALTLALTLFWAWLALGLLWSRVPYVSMVNFWWVGSFAFVFWLATLTPEPERCWHWSSRAVLLLGVALACMALYQLLVLNSDPRSTFLSRNSHAAMLILIAIPASSHFLTASGGRRMATGAALFLLFLATAVTGSRGVLLSLLLGAGLLAAVAYRHVERRRLAVWVAIILGAYLAANLLLQGWLAGRLSSVFDPTYAGHDRFLIWRQALKMALEAPWSGVGLGTYWLFWPPYRHPLDSSAGFYVHNDYLQIWIETGLPGLLLLLAVELAVLVIFIRFLRNTQATTAERVEMAGLFGGLLAIAFHTFFDFDLYIQPILMVIGLLLARMHFLYTRHASITSLDLRPSRRVGRRAWLTITLLLLLFPVLYFAALGTSAYLTMHGRKLAAQGRWVDASITLSRAWRLMPTSDLTLVTHADLLRYAIQALPPAAPHRTTLFNEALALLRDAERVNPVRSQIFYIRGLLYQQNPALAGPRWFELAADSYRRVLRIDPRSFWARMAYAQLLLGQKRLAEAREVLEGGIHYWYYPEPNVFGYYALTAELRHRSGDLGGARALRKKLAQMQQSMRVRPAPFDPFSSPAPAKKP